MNLERLLGLDVSELARLEPEPDWSLGMFVAAACLLEAAAPKAGNVHPDAAFVDMCYEDFRRSARAIAPVFDDESIQSVGDIVLQAVEATQQVVTVNTNLGIILLLAPLAHSYGRGAGGEGDRTANWTRGVEGNRRARTRSLLKNLTPHDSRQIYQAIQLAKAGGLGQVENMDIHSQPPENILDAMRVASAWDDIATEYVNGFSGVFAMADRLTELRHEKHGDWLAAICRLQVERLAECGDSLIARKNGASIVEEVKRLAKAALKTSPNDAMTDAYPELDTFLRADGHRRNPGTTADLIAAATFIALLSRR